MAIKIFKGVQGDAHWHNELRSGVLTGSEFPKVVTGKGVFSKSSADLADTKAFERFTGIQEQSPQTFVMKEGHRKEDKAKELYSLLTGYEETEVSFIRDMSKPYGISPDFVSLDANDNIIKLAEIKSLKGGLWSKTYRTKQVPSKYIPQVQGQLLTCEMDSLDFIMYSEDGGLYWFPVYRDEPYIAKLRDAFKKFEEEVQKYHKVLLNATDIWRI